MPKKPFEPDKDLYDPSQEKKDEEEKNPRDWDTLLQEQFENSALDEEELQTFLCAETPPLEDLSQPQRLSDSQLQDELVDALVREIDNKEYQTYFCTKVSSVENLSQCDVAELKGAQKKSGEQQKPQAEEVQKKHNKLKRSAAVLIKQGSAAAKNEILTKRKKQKQELDQSTKQQQSAPSVKRK